MKFVKKTNYYTGIVYEWNLPSGFSCPFAMECLVKVDRETGKFDNRSNQFRCYSASAERFPGVREHRWINFDHVRSGKRPEIPKNAKAIRIHASGDFYSQAYFDMWLDICRENPDIEFWAYTKSLIYWVNRIYSIPDNLVLTASNGGKQDKLIQEFKLKNVIVVKNAGETDRQIDTNDDLARIPGLNFALIDNFVK